MSRAQNGKFMKPKLIRKISIFKLKDQGHLNEKLR